MAQSLPSGPTGPVLVLDLGAKTGWACLDGGEMLSGCLDFSSYRKDRSDLLDAFDLALSNLTGRYRPALVIYARPSPNTCEADLASELAELVEATTREDERRVTEATTLRAYGSRGWGLSGDASVRHLMISPDKEIEALSLLHLFVNANGTA